MDIYFNTFLELNKRFLQNHLHYLLKRHECRELPLFQIYIKSGSIATLSTSVPIY